MKQEMAAEFEEAKSQLGVLKEKNAKLEAHAMRLDEEAELAKVLKGKPCQT